MLGPQNRGTTKIGLLWHLQPNTFRDNNLDAAVDLVNVRLNLLLARVLARRERLCFRQATLNLFKIVQILCKLGNHFLVGLIEELELLDNRQNQRVESLQIAPTGGTPVKLVVEDIPNIRLELGSRLELSKDNGSCAQSRKARKR